MRFRCYSLRQFVGTFGMPPFRVIRLGGTRTKRWRRLPRSFRPTGRVPRIDGRALLLQLDHDTPMPRSVSPCLILAVACCFGFCLPAMAAETVTFQREGRKTTVVAEVMIEAADGGLMLQSDDGRIWILQPEEIKDRKSDPAELEPIDPEEMERRVLAELPQGFKVYKTQHYLIFYKTNEAYVKRVGLLYEQLYRGFFTYWKNSRWDLPEPRFPLVSLVLPDHASFLRHGRGEIGDTANNLIGYFHLESNRMTTFNVPNWERNAATIIHEATHQLAYNCGLQQRFADNPMWVSEGLATFFESPDRRNPNRWQRIGRVNQVQLRRWQQFSRKRPADSLTTLLANDDRYRKPGTSTNAYSEGWALTYFLIKTKRKEYVDYLRILSEGRPLAELTARERIDMFEQAFGMSLDKLDAKFVSYMRSVR